jgi:hypothetical protein
VGEASSFLDFLADLQAFCPNRRRYAVASLGAAADEATTLKG